MAKKTSPQNKSEQIYCTVREEIVTGKYLGGTFLIEGDLCEQFAVSRTPVREALIRLAQDNFVELIPNRGAYVPHITLSDIAEICQIRAANEGLAAFLLAKNCPAAVLTRLEESVTREEAMLEDPSANPKDISNEDFNFHIIIAKYCGNSRLAQMLNLIENQMKRFAYLSADNHAAAHTLRISVAAHRATVEAIRAGDADTARDRLAEHWWAMLDGYFQRSMAGMLPLQL